MIPVAVPWYESQDDFNAILDILPVEEAKRAHTFERTRENSIRFEKLAADAGQMPVRVKIDSASIQSWCKDNKRRVTIHAIRDYSIMKAAEGILERGSN
jgi:hypothetical protein